MFTQRYQRNEFDNYGDRELNEDYKNSFEPIERNENTVERLYGHSLDDVLNQRGDDLIELQQDYLGTKYKFTNPLKSYRSFGRNRKKFFF